MEFFRIGKVTFAVSLIGAEETSFNVELQGKENKHSAPTEVEVKADDVNLDSVKTQLSLIQLMGRCAFMQL